MNSIYKQLDKIDDNKSLNEKYNVRNQCELKKLKESLTEEYITDKDNSLVKEIQEYIHDNIFGCEEIGFDKDHIYAVFEDEDSVESCMDELYDAFDDLSFDTEDETTLHIYVEQNTELNDERYESFVESRVDYRARAKDAEIWTDGDDIGYRWISQESSSEDDAFDVAKATNDYLVSLGRVDVKVSGTYWCRSYPDDTYAVSFITKKDLKYSDIEDATVYEYGIIDDSEYFEEEYTTDWNEALETFNNIAHRVQKRLVDMDDEEYEDYYSDGVVVRMITGKEGSDAWDWDTIREVTVFRDHIENEEALEESINQK